MSCCRPWRNCRPPTAGRCGSPPTATIARSAAPSGALPAFTAAWERPDAFRRVFSAIGTYVGLRGGNNYPTLVRKFEPKPIRIFLQDGSKDQNIYGGDWWMANLEMERALTFAGYEVNHAWGEGGHDGKHATEIFPDAMRLLWKDWPAVKAGGGSPQLRDVVRAGEDWQLVAEGYKFTEGPAANAAGEVFFNDVPASRPIRFLSTAGSASSSRTPMAAMVRPSVPMAACMPWREPPIRLSRTTPRRGHDHRAWFSRQRFDQVHDGGIYATNPGWNGIDQARSGTSVRRAKRNRSTRACGFAAA